MPNLTTDILLRSEETGGHVSVTEIVVPPHSAGPPLHTHDFDEASYMLEGELTFQVGDALVTKGAGELSFAPRNVAHTLANHSDAPARYLLVCTPAGFERHWARMAADAADWWHVVVGPISAAIDPEDREFLATAYRIAGEIDWTGDPWHALTGALKDATGRKGKPLFLPLRRALTGMDHGPDMAALLPLIGRYRALERLGPG